MTNTNQVETVTLMTQLLLNNGADIAIDDGEPIYDTISHNNELMVKLLLDRGANNRSSLRMVTYNGNAEIVLDHGADIHEVDDETIRLSLERNHKEIVEILLNRGVDIHADKHIRTSI